MAKYPDLITTKKGLDLNSAANAAQKAVIFTKVVAGDGDVPSGTSISDLTAVVSPKMTLEITNKENWGNGHFTIRATLGNEELDSGFYAKEIGVYAKLDGDVEVLYAYTNGGNYVDYIPDRSSPIDAQVFNIDVIIGNLQQATILINDETHVTKKDLEDHDKADTAHENRFSLFQKIATLGDDIIKKLALTTTITAINALQTNSWFGQLLKMVLNASGVKYSIAQNGYICLGSFFGGLIIQWGKSEANAPSGGVRLVYFPLSVDSEKCKIIVTHYNGTLTTSMEPLSVGTITENSFILSFNVNQYPTAFYIVISY